MGVKGLWKLIECSGVPVPLETLEHKILAVDVSIWLHQAVHGFRGPGGGAVANAHLLTLFHRICKLLFYRIRPVFVFDGGVPHLKKQTLASRRLRREVAASKAKEVRERLLSNLLKSQAVRKALGRTGPVPSDVHVARPKEIKKDIFELPPLTEEGKMLLNSESDKRKSVLDDYNLPNLHYFEFESEDFKALPLETQHEILSELQTTRKENSWKALNEMPQESTNFAVFQMDRLLKRRRFQSTLDDVRDGMQKKKAAELEAEMFGELEKHVSVMQRIASEDSAHSIFIKKVPEISNEPNIEEIDIQQDTKGKSPLKRKREDFEKDFLCELEKQGIFKTRRISDSESDSDVDDDYYLFGEGVESATKDSGNQDEDSLNFDAQALLKVVNSLLDNDGLSQEEILALIKQNDTKEMGNEQSNGIDGPSTSGSAPGFVFNPDADSSDDDSDFIEVSETMDQPSLLDDIIETKETSKEDSSMNNVKKVLETKNNSLWIKIMQQRLDDLVHMDSDKKSPKKALVDSRSMGGEKKGSSVKSSPEKPKSISISLDLDVKPLRMEDDIFADVFLDIGTSMGEKLSSKSTSLKVISNPRKLCRSSDFPEKPLQVISVPKTTYAKGCPSTIGENRNRDDGNIEWQASSKSQLPVHSLKDIDVGNEAKVGDSSIIQIEALKDTKINDGEAESDVEIMSSGSDSDLEECEVTEQEALKVDRNETDEPAIGLGNVEPTQEIVDEAVVDDVEMMDSSEDSDDVIRNAKNPDVESGNGDIRDIKAVGTSSSLSSKSDSSKKAIDLEAEGGKVKEKEDACEGTKMYLKEIVKGKVSDDDKLKDKQIMENKEMEVEGEKSPSTLPTEQDKEDEDSLEDPERPLDYSEDELKRLEGELASEQRTLVAQAQKVERVSANINDQMYGESQDLLQLFGIPYLVAPMEAEAQCGYLEGIHLTAGTITDDSDIFLFGGNKVYKNFFNQTKQVEFFKTDNVAANIGLNREKMITIALLTGSDYTEGIESVGAVSAMEVLAEFSGEGIDCLRALKKWWNVAHKNVMGIYLSKVKQKLTQVHLPESFPSEKVYQAYLEPEVDESRDKFSWSVPNVDALRQFTMDKFGWNRDKADQILLPVMKKLGLKSSQMRIDSYFTNIKLVKDTQIKSKRMQDAIAKAKGEEPPSAKQSAATFKRPGNPVRKTPAGKRRKVETPVEDSIVEENNDNLNSPVKKPSRTLLMDPSESKSGPEREGEKPKATRKKKKVDQEKKSGGPIGNIREAEEEYTPPRKLTKEIMFKALLKKQTISQRESDKQGMEERKKMAAELLKNKIDKRTKKR